MKLRTRIALAMMTLVTLSLIIIGVFTIWFFKEQNEEYHRERLDRKESAIRKEMEYYSSDLEQQDNYDVVFKGFEEQVLRISKVHNLELNIFNSKGQLMVSSEGGKTNSDYYQKTVPDRALEGLKDTNRIIIPEVEGNRFYLSDYTLLKGTDGRVIAIMNLPYIRTSDVNQKDLGEFLGSLGLMYIFIFLGAIGLIILLSRYITRSLGLLGDKMENVAFLGENEPLEWNRGDEIGMLVARYNTMLAKLEESRKALAKNERESAWREMAKQVAHEIKNPLTPMKLSVQHLVSTADNKDDRWQEKFDRTTSMLIDQIDSLSRIASDFSDFAKMPKAQIGDVYLRDVYQKIKDLFSEAPFEWTVSEPDPSIIVRMDRDQLLRVLNNLVKNAKHAVADKSDPSVHLTHSLKGDTLSIEVHDNGIGITEEVSKRIFQPNFTTKSSGTGLGLAICRQIVEEAGGTISFVSRQGEGTTFRVSLPLADTKNQ